MHCGPLSDPDEQNLRTLEKHMVVACRRVLAVQKLQPWPQVSLSTGSSEKSLVKPEPVLNESYDELDRKILQLCGMRSSMSPIPLHSQLPLSGIELHDYGED
ncbi:hypothetical protein GDO78_016269 [Eleutherodactylus coqui]|uniref:Uncharacterized protein n=1 Tax=Eleutherodactylus coqui TaxID=57060 RepID=A0A8J6EBW4_ELECQ|nr:hypothetical protein GDO78_016269 [Eleutherodactylus coqui]